MSNNIEEIWKRIHTWLDANAPQGYVAPSLRSWLEDFANKLDDDEFAYSESDGCVMYADEIDIE